MSEKYRPEQIYLQVTDDDGEALDVDTEEITWCADDQHQGDIKYIRADIVRKLEAENLWMRREIERVGHAIYTGDKGYVGTEEDLQAIGQSVEGICETLDRMIEPEAENEKLQEAQITRQLGRIRRGEDLTTPTK